MENSLFRRCLGFFQKLNNNIFMLAIRQGLLLSIPIVIVGSLALILITFPIQGYQDFIQTVLNGTLYQLISLIYQVTLGSISLVLLVSISYSYGELSGQNQSNCCIMIITSLCSYMILSYDQLITTPPNLFSSVYLFTAVFAALSCSFLFIKINSLSCLKSSFHHSETDCGYYFCFRTFIPSLVILIIFALLNILVQQLGFSNISNLFMTTISHLFDGLGRNFFSSILFILFSHFLWFFGIHGTNMFEPVTQNLFMEGMFINQELVAMGSLPTEIFTKTFFDTFAMLGGSGSTLCLVLAIFFFNRHYHLQKMATFSLLPSVFNINEPIILGLPLIFNPVLFIPFLITPIVFTLTSAFAMQIGLVPLTTTTVVWTTPILLSGYIATGSLMGSLLQLFNLVIGILMYIPFMYLNDKVTALSFQSGIDELVDIVRDCESLGTSPNLLNRKDHLGIVSKTLKADLEQAIHQKNLNICFQPQVNFDGRVVGAEALLRWKHSDIGYIYPPLIIALAQQANLLDQLGLLIIEQTCHAIESIKKQQTSPMNISVNISIAQLDHPDFVSEVTRIIEHYQIAKGELGIEFTEQIALKNTPIMNTRIQALRDLGILIILDDFGMGHGSMSYLQNNQFDMVKLDGSLVKEITSNQRSIDIIDSIMRLSYTLNFLVVAEYVETIQHRDQLNSIGPMYYQGYLYSPAIPLEDFIVFSQSIHAK